MVDLEGRALFIFSETNCFRRMCARISGHGRFETIILFLIIFSTIMLTQESPLLNPGSFQYKILI